VSARTDTHDRLTHALGVLAAACAVPLVLFGGSVTTLGAGMAVEGWLIAEGHFLLLFPVESWLRDTGTFVEHTHRLFGVLVGLVAIGACAAAWRARRAGRRTSLAAPALALAAVCAQGALGGFRVLEDSADLAFLHGVFAQATFALLAIAAVVASRPWAETPAKLATPDPRTGARLGRLAALATAVVFAQVALGAWYRHGLRPAPVAGSELRLALHFAGAAAAFVAVALLAAAAQDAARTLAAPAAAVLARGARRLHLLLGVQIALGLCAWAGYRPGSIGPAEWGLSILHVLVGALLLGQCALLLAWSRRVRAPRRAHAGLTLEAAR
jgi:cytochrome c oxidase assembly protein subunit 15